MGIQRKQKGNNVKVIKDLDNKRVKKEIDPPLHNRLIEGHVATTGEVRPLISSSPASRVPQPKLGRNKTQLFIR